PIQPGDEAFAPASVALRLPGNRWHILILSLAGRVLLQIRNRHIRLLSVVPVNRYCFLGDHGHTTYFHGLVYPRLCVDEGYLCSAKNHWPVQKYAAFRSAPSRRNENLLNFRSDRRSLSSHR